MLKTLAIAIAIALSFSATNAHSQNRFGWDGMDGRDGFSGQDGRSGQDVTIFADGTPMQYQLNGTDGSAGDDGTPGEDARSCFQHRSNYDERGADGGDGGDGGRGGHGGDGGSVDLYYTNIGHLKSIYIASLPGRGSMGGNASYGGRGCYCTWRSWSEQRCRVVKNPDGTTRKECWYETYHCWDGMTGRNGMKGSNGRAGTMGSAILIPSATEVLPDYTSESQDISALNGYSVTLGKNNFVSKSGLLALLAPGSVISDTYSLWTGRDEKSANVRWTATRNASDFKGQKANFSFAPTIQMTFPTSIMSSVKATVIQGGQNSHIEYLVTAAVPRAEAENVKFAFEGTGYDTIVRVLDAALEPKLLTDTYDLKLYRDRFGGDDLNWEGTLTPEYITHDGKNVILKIGKLPAKDADKTFKPGKDIKVVFKMTRQLGTSSATIKTDKIEYRLPKKK